MTGTRAKKWIVCPLTDKCSGTGILCSETHKARGEMPLSLQWEVRYGAGSGGYRERVPVPVGPASSVCVDSGNERNTLQGHKDFPTHTCTCELITSSMWA